jgi:hypothetical protein
LDAERQLQHHGDKFETLPGRDAIQRMELSLATLDKHIAVLSARLEPVAAIAERMQELMLQGASK